MSKKSNFSISLRLWILTLLFLVNIGILGAISYWNSKRLVRQLEEISNLQLPAVRNMALTDMMHDGIRGTVYHGILVALEGKKDAYANVKAELLDYSNNIRKYILSLDSLNVPPETHQAIASTLPKIDAYLGSAKKIIEWSQTGSLEEAKKLVPNFQNDFKLLEEELEVLGDLIEKGAKESNLAVVAVSKQANISSIVIMLLGLMVALIFAVLLIRGVNNILNSIIKKLVGESFEVSEKASQLATSAQELAEATTEQASALQETTASVQHIATMAQRTGRNSEQLEKNSQQSFDAASRGQEAVAQMLEAMDRIGISNAKIIRQVEDGNQKITEISKVIGEIGEKTKIINEIVFQTKLLSFNASVEAARAGEHGKGFAVVAEEVGNLAQMSGNAAKEISGMLSESVQKVENIVKLNKDNLNSLTAEGRSMVELGTTVAKRCGSALDAIVKQTNDLTVMVTEIGSAIREETQGVNEISKAILLLESSTNKNSSTSMQTSKTSKGLSQQAQNLREIVGELRTIVLGSKSEAI